MKKLSAFLVLCLVFGMFSALNTSACADNEKTENTLFTENGFSMSVDDFVEHLASYLPNDVVICTENRFNDNAWIYGSTFSVTSSDLNPDSRYIRVWYAQSSPGSHTDHIDAYFYNASDFVDIAEFFFAAIDPEYVKSEEFQDDLKTILHDINRKIEKTNYIEMANGYFAYYYTAPYKIVGTMYPGFFGIRFISSEFFQEIN